jgi:hypothetical protein
MLKQIEECTVLNGSADWSVSSPLSRAATVSNRHWRCCRAARVSCRCVVLLPPRRQFLSCGDPFERSVPFSSLSSRHHCQGRAQARRLDWPEQSSPPLLVKVKQICGRQYLSRRLLMIYILMISWSTSWVRYTR